MNATLHLHKDAHDLASNPPLSVSVRHAQQRETRRSRLGSSFYFPEMVGFQPHLAMNGNMADSITVTYPGEEAESNWFIG